MRIRTTSVASVAFVAAGCLSACGGGSAGSGASATPTAATSAPTSQSKTTVTTNPSSGTTTVTTTVPGGAGASGSGANTHQGGSSGTSSTSSAASTVKGSSFVTADGSMACAYDFRAGQTRCLNLTQGWPATKHNCYDVDHTKIAESAFLVEMTRRGPGKPECSTQGPTYKGALEQPWWHKGEPTQRVRLHTLMMGDYVDQTFAVLKPGRTMTFPDGVRITAGTGGVSGAGWKLAASQLG